MHAFDVLTLILLLSALITFVNARFIHLPPTVAYMLGSLVVAIVLLILYAFEVEAVRGFVLIFREIDFSSTVLYGILSFLLFAGAMQLELKELAKQKWVVLTLATFGVVISTFIVGTLMYYVFEWFNIHISYLLALTFGALISPTDPVVVMGMFRGTPAPKSLKIKIMAEALFNDGAAIVLFVILSTLATVQTELKPSNMALLLVQQILGAIVLGLVGGWITHALLVRLEGYTNRILITLGLVSGIYDLALILNFSGPITVALMGLVVRNYKTGEHHFRARLHPVWEFWSLVDELLNAALFLLLGFEVLSLRFSLPAFGAGIVGIAVVLIARLISVWIPIRFFRFFQTFTKGVVPLLTWAGVRGGVSLALALSLPHNVFTNAILLATYVGVVFSICVQGLTFAPLVRRFSP